MTTKRYQIVAFAYDKHGRLISTGKNSYVKTHPLQAKYGARSGNQFKIYIHAELMAILKAGKRHIHRLVVTRFNDDGSPGNAKPCPSCQLAIKDFNVGIVEHT